LEEAGVRVSHRRFEAKEVIYTYGDPDRYLYFLTEGVLKLYKRYAGHKEAIVSLLEEGSVFGEPAPRAGGAHRDSAQAASACRVAVVDKAALEHHVQQDPRCALALLVAYAQWVQRHERAFARLIPREIRARLAGALLEVANRFGESTSEEGIALGMHLTHQTLAEMIVSSRPGVSKEMARFGREGLVETRGKAWIVLLDEARLTEITRSR
jgi:CRP/FNR family transcriptional regulator, cyclic AMP receptor protein